MININTEYNIYSFILILASIIFLFIPFYIDPRLIMGIMCSCSKEHTSTLKPTKKVSLHLKSTV